MTGLEEIVICDGVTEITPFLFTNLSGSASVKKLVIPESVRSIGKRAFGNSGLSGTVVIPDSVTSIGEGCFRHCDKLEKIVLPKGLTTLETTIFYDCDSLTEIVLPAALSSIGSGAFADIQFGHVDLDGTELFFICVGGIQRVDIDFFTGFQGFLQVEDAIDTVVFDIGTPMIQFRGGILYNANNSNNVVSARINMAVGLQAAAVYTTRLFKRPLALRYQASLPIVGAFFSPEYDEAYYEIYLGNRRHLAHLGWWGSRFDMDNLVTADWHLGGTIVRLGYRCRIEKSWVSHIDTRHVTHSLVVGLGGEFLTLSPSHKLSEKARVASVLFDE
jgi:hypothetical protein